MCARYLHILKCVSSPYIGIHPPTEAYKTLQRPTCVSYSYMYLHIPKCVSLSYMCVESTHSVTFPYIPLHPLHARTEAYRAHRTYIHLHARTGPYRPSQDPT